MMIKFNNLEEFNKFCDTSMFCVCGNLMTGLHMSGCQRLKKMRIKLIEQEKQNSLQKPSPDKKERN